MIDRRYRRHARQWRGLACRHADEDIMPRVTWRRD